MHITAAMTYKAILQMTADYLQAQANPQNVIKYSRYFREGYDAWGCNEGSVKQAVQMIREQYPELTTQQVIELGNLLFKNGKYEMASTAILLLSTRIKDFSPETWEGVRGWFDHGVTNWAHNDTLCSMITPPFILKGIVKYTELRKWLKSESRWTRRAVPVTLLCLRKTENPVKLLDLVEPLMLDAERVVHQGMGWFLRELWKIHPAPVEEMLYKYRNTAARLIIQYATEKMSKEHKERFRKEKK